VLAQGEKKGGNRQKKKTKIKSGAKNGNEGEGFHHPLSEQDRRERGGGGGGVKKGTLLARGL